MAHRYKLSFTLVAWARMRIPDSDEITLRVLEQGMDAADGWIVEHLEANDIVITAASHAACGVKRCFSWLSWL